jgi:hypothetical protein
MQYFKKINMEKNTKILIGVAAAGVVLYLISKSKSKSTSTDTAVVDMSTVVSNRVILGGTISSREDRELALRWMVSNSFNVFPNINKNLSQGYGNYIKLIALLDASDKKIFTEILKKAENVSQADIEVFTLQLWPKMQNLNIQLQKDFVPKEQPTWDDYQILIEQANLLNPELKDYIEELKQKQATAPN